MRRFALALSLVVLAQTVAGVCDVAPGETVLRLRGTSRERADRLPLRVAARADVVRRGDPGGRVVEELPRVDDLADVAVRRVPGARKGRRDERNIRLVTLVSDGQAAHP